jgi:hypothetical protein
VKNIHHAIVALFALLVSSWLLAPAASAQREVKDPPAIWIHKATGVGFPTTIGEFRRYKIDEYNDDGTDASVGYDLIRNERKIGYVTVYIFPPYDPGDCAHQFAGIEDDVRQSYQNVELIAETDAKSPSGRNPGGRLAAFRFDAKFDGSSQRVRSDAYLFCPAGGKWLVTYRATWLNGIDIHAEVTALMQSFAWPDLLDR